MLGLYKHYKGGLYKILYLARDSETLSTVIVYQDLREPNKIWTRSKVEFEADVVLLSGNRVKRFAPLTEGNCPHVFEGSAEPECKWCGYVKSK